MTRKKIKLLSGAPHGEDDTPVRLTYWRSSRTCFSIDYKGIITEICEGDLGYGDMNRMDEPPDETGEMIAVQMGDEDR